MPTETAERPAAASNGEATVMLRPFRVGVQEMDEDVYDEQVALGTGAKTLRQYDIPSTAFLRACYMLVEATGTANTATATGTGAAGVLVEDGPYTVIDQFQFTDTNSSEIIGPINGYDLFVLSKWGGYCFDDDPEANSDIFSATSNATASSSAAGSFSFLLRIPLELVPRDALGTLVNKSSSTPFKIKITLAASSNVYESDPSTLPTIRVRIMPDSYWEPTDTDGSGNPVAQLPPGVNTTQYWNVTPYQGLAAGTINQPLNNSVGYPIRNLIFALRDSNGTRSQGESDFPDPFQLQLQSNLIVNRLKKIWKKKLQEDYGYGPTGDSAGQKDNGIYTLPFCRDFGPKPGWETRRGYLRTTDGMRLQVKGSIGGSGSHSLTVYTNYVGLGQGVTLAAVTT